MIGKKYVWDKPAESEDELLNQRGKQYFEKKYEVVEEIKNGKGHIKTGDTIWGVAGPATEKGKMVRVVDLEGSTLIVELVEP